MNRIKNEEHEKHYFGFTATEIYSSLQHSIINCVDVFFNECKMTLMEEKKENFDTLIKQFRELYVNKTLKVLEEFMNTLQIILHIPQNAPIYEYKSETFYSEEQVLALMKEKVELEKTYYRHKIYIKLLKEELQLIDTLKPTYLKVKELLLEFENEQKCELEDWLEKCMTKFSPDIESKLNNLSIS